MFLFLCRAKARLQLISYFDGIRKVGTHFVIMLRIRLGWVFSGFFSSFFSFFSLLFLFCLFFFSFSLLFFLVGGGAGGRVEGHARGADVF